MSALPERVDVVVAGSGATGMAAALTLAQGGAKVAVFEKQRSLGGTSNFFQGTFAVESAMQRERYVDYTRDQAFKNTMDYSHWRANPRLGAGYRGRVRGDDLLAAGRGRIVHRGHHQHARFASHLSHRQGPRRSSGQGSGGPGPGQGRPGLSRHSGGRAAERGRQDLRGGRGQRRRRGGSGRQGGCHRHGRLRQQQGLGQEVHRVRPRA